jgi:hypothetical protein
MLDHINKSSKGGRRESILHVKSLVKIFLKGVGDVRHSGGDARTSHIFNHLREDEKEYEREKVDLYCEPGTWRGISCSTALARASRARGASSSCWKSAGSRLPEGRNWFMSDQQSEFESLAKCC